MLRRYNYSTKINHQVSYGYTLTIQMLVRKLDKITDICISNALSIDGLQSKQLLRQFAVGRNKSAQVVRKQSPLRQAAAKKSIRGDTKNRVLVNFNIKRKVPHIHYVGLSRVTAI